jgi:hypothetical protein
MCERERNIFFKLTAENENTTTELLCNLCGRDEYKDVILGALCLNGLNIEFKNIRTQKQIPKKKETS